MKKLFISALLGSFLLSTSLHASYVCEKDYEEKLARMKKKEGTRSLARIGMIAGVALPSVVGGLVLGAVTAGPAGAAGGALAAGTGSMLLIQDVIFREETLTSTYEMFYLADFTKEEEFQEWQRRPEIRKLHQYILNHPASFTYHLRLANETKLNGKTWDIESYKFFLQDPHYTDYNNFYGEAHINEIDRLVQKVNSKSPRAVFSYDDVRFEIARISNGDACARKRLMGLNRLKKRVINNLIGAP